MACYRMSARVYIWLVTACQHVHINGTADNPKVEGVYVVKTEAADKCNGKIAYHHHSGDASLHYTTDGGWSIGSEPCGTEKWLYKSGSKLFDGDPTIVWQEYDGTVMKDNSNISLVCVTGKSAEIHILYICTAI